MSEKLIQRECFQANIWRYISYTSASSHRDGALPPASAEALGWESCCVICNRWRLLPEFLWGVRFGGGGGNIWPSWEAVINLSTLALNLQHMPSPKPMHSAELGQGLSSVPTRFTACAFWAVAASFAQSNESCMHLKKYFLKSCLMCFSWKIPPRASPSGYKLRLLPSVVTAKPEWWLQQCHLYLSPLCTPHCPGLNTSTHPSPPDRNTSISAWEIWSLLWRHLKPPLLLGASGAPWYCK